MCLNIMMRPRLITVWQILANGFFCSHSLRVTICFLSHRSLILDQWMLLHNFTAGVFSISLCCEYYQQENTNFKLSGLAYYRASSLPPMDTNIVKANKSSLAKWQQQQLPKILNSSINIAVPCQINMCKKYLYEFQFQRRRNL